MAIGTCVLSYAERLPRSADHGDLASHLCLQQALLQQNRAEMLPPPERWTVIVGKGRIGPEVSEERFQNWRKRRIVRKRPVATAAIGRFSDEILRYAAAQADVADESCNFNLNNTNSSLLRHPQQQCLSIEDDTPDVLLIGDSHMWALADGLRSALKSQRIDNYFVSHTSCLPLIGFVTYDAGKTYDCDEFLNSTYAWASQAKIKTLVLAARFPLYLDGNRYNNGEGGVESGVPGWVDLVGRATSQLDDAARHARVLAAYEQGIRELANRFNLVLVYPVPEAGWNVPNHAFKTALFNDGDATVTTSYAAYIERTREVNALFDRLVAELPNVHGARVHEVLCSGETGRCVNADANGVYYYDDDHLSNAGARLVAPVIVEAIQNALGNGD